MRRIVALLLVMTITISSSAMAESGINEEPNLSGTDLESVFFPNEASAGDEFRIHVEHKCARFIRTRIMKTGRYFWNGYAKNTLSA